MIPKGFYNKIKRQYCEPYEQLHYRDDFFLILFHIGFLFVLI